jgi:hypothetical protein
MAMKRVDDSATVSIVAEIEADIQEVCSELDHLRRTPPALENAGDVLDWERKVQRLTDRLRGLITAEAIQRQIDQPAFKQKARQLAQSGPKKMRDQGLRPVTLRLSGGQEVVVKASYFSRNETTAWRGKGFYPALLLLGIYHRCTPALATDVAQLSAAMGSLEEAQEQLEHQGVKLAVKTISSIAYQFAERARAAQRAGVLELGSDVVGRRVVVSTDGGRVRVRKDKRGKKTKKGRRRYHTHWREPKLLIIYVVDASGRLDREFAPLIDGTMNGPDVIFALIRYYLSELDIGKADCVLFVADGARWIWGRVARLWRAVNLRPEQCYELVDFYHVVEHLYKLASLKRKWTARQRRRWASRQRRGLLKGKLKQVLEEIKKQTSGRISKELRRERDYFLRNAEAGRLNYATVAAKKLPIGSGSMESSMRRVVNLRLKGAGIFWHEESANAMLLLRSYYKAGRWKLLEKQSLTADLRMAA